MPGTPQSSPRKTITSLYPAITCTIIAGLAGLSLGLLTPAAGARQSEPTAATPPTPPDRVDGVSTRARWSQGQDTGDRPVQVAAAGARMEAMAMAEPTEERRQIEEALRIAQQQGRQDEVMRLQQMLNAMGAQTARASGMGDRPAGAMPNAVPLPAGAAGAFQNNDEPISIRFGESVNLKDFAEWVATGLGINIFSDPTVADRRVSFIAPMTVKPPDLLRLLETLLEDQGFALTFDDQLGVYKIVQATNVAVGFRGDQATTRVIPTPMLRPSTLQQSITASMGAGAAGAASVRMSPIDELGVLIVTGTPPTVRMVEDFVNKLLKEFANQRLYRYPLTNVSADFAVQRILQLNGRLGGAPAGVAQGIQQQQGQPQVAGVGGSLTNLESRLFTDQSNAIIFRGSEAESDQIGQLVSIVDSVITLIARRYIVGNQAQLVAETGERMGLGPVTTSSSGQGQFGNSGFNRQQQFAQQGFGGAGGQALTASGFVIDPDTGSIIYHGTEQQHEIVAALVDDFNKQAIDENVELQVYKLKYIKAVETAELLQNIIQDPSQATANSPFFPRSGQGGTAANRVNPATGDPAAEAEAALGGATAENTVIVPDEPGNQLIIKATARAQRQFGDLLKRIDRRKPQVNISAKLVAVSSSKSFEWTADVQLNAGQFSFLSTFGLTSAPANAALDTVRTIGSPAGDAFPGRGATAALIKSDFLPFAISALERVGDTRIMSNPRIIVNDNYTAEFGSTREEPFTQTSQTAGNPLVTSQGGVAEAGTKLTVTPRISAGGDLVLEYEVELSDFDQGARLNENVAPPKNKESYKSEVTVPTDSTVVVGGFTLQRRTEQKDRVPVLGWIPLLGAMFTDYGDADRTITVFVFITPTVLNDENFLDLQLISEGWIEEAGIDPDRPPMEPAVMPLAGISVPRLTQATPVTPIAPPTAVVGAGD